MGKRWSIEIVESIPGSGYVCYIDRHDKDGAKIMGVANGINTKLAIMYARRKVRRTLAHEWAIPKNNI